MRHIDFIGITIAYNVELSKLNCRRQVYVVILCLVNARVVVCSVNSAMHVKIYEQAKDLLEIVIKSLVGLEFSKEC